MKLEWKPLLRISVCVLAVYLCIFYWPTVATLLGTALGALSPILISIAVAYVVNILMSFYERHYFTKWNLKPIVYKTRRPICMVMAIITLLAIVFLIGWLVVPRLATCVTLIVSKIPSALEKIFQSEFLEKVLPASVLESIATINWNEFITKAVDFIASGIGSATNVVVTVVSSVISTVTTVFLSIIFAVYMLLSKEKLLAQLRRVIHCYFKKSEKRALYVGTVLNRNFHNFIVGQCTEALILGLLCTVGMLIFRFPYATMVGTFIGFTALIPVAGAYIGAGVGALIIFTESPVKALLFILFILILQNLEGNLIYPKVVGDSIGLPGLWVLVAITIGGGLFGVGGMLFGVPLMATIYQLTKEDMKKRELKA